jgi:hypothetical protein
LLLNHRQRRIHKSTRTFDRSELSDNKSNQSLFECTTSRMPITAHFHNASMFSVFFIFFCFLGTFFTFFIFFRMFQVVFFTNVFYSHQISYPIAIIIIELLLVVATSAVLRGELTENKLQRKIFRKLGEIYFHLGRGGKRCGGERIFMIFNCLTGKNKI